MAQRILIAAGGTGGHLFPAQALAAQLTDCEILFAGHGLARNPYIDPEHARVDVASSGRIHWRLVRGTGQAIRLLRSWRPDLVVGFGSFHSFPLLVAAKLLGIPYLLHESNAHPGRVNRLFSGGALLTATHFPSVSLRGTVVQIQPLTRFATLPTREEAAAHYGLDPARPILLAFGGSQGAASIDRAVHELNLLGWQILHLTRDNFEPRMERAWACADLALTRAGASTLAEAMQTNTPSILIPWPGALEDHQAANARALADLGGAIVIPQWELTSELLMQTIGAAQRGRMEACLQGLHIEMRPTLAHLVAEQLATTS